MNVKVQYEPQRIKYIAVQCPKCHDWFDGRDIIADDGKLDKSSDIYTRDFKCPLCGKLFSYAYDECMNITEDYYPGIFKDIRKGKVNWS